MISRACPPRTGVTIGIPAAESGQSLGRDGLAGTKVQCMADSVLAEPVADDHELPGLQFGLQLFQIWCCLSNQMRHHPVGWPYGSFAFQGSPAAPGSSPAERQLHRHGQRPGAFARQPRWQLLLRPSAAARGGHDRVERNTVILRATDTGKRVTADPDGGRACTAAILDCRPQAR